MTTLVAPIATPAARTMGFIERLHAPERPVLVFDGATGTSLQQMDLSAADFGGAALEGCNENLVFTRPDAVQAVHRQFLAAGCDVIETDTFGAASIVLVEYGLEDRAFAINQRAAELAREVALEFSTADQPRYVAGSIGPTTKLPTLGHIDFDAMKASFQEQAEGLIAGDVDLLLVETCQDVLQIKAALQGIEAAFSSTGQRRPLMVSVTMETTGTMLVGSDIAAVVAILEPFPIDILGLNCATGPEQMKEHVRYLSAHSPFVVSCIPNAGLPENVGGVAHYRLTPLEMKMQLMHFVEDLGVQVIGGCCGTTPAHIGALAELAQDLHPKPRQVRLPEQQLSRPALQSEPAASSIYGITPYQQDNSFLIIGERLNASGSKKVRELLNQEDWDGLVALARGQVKENAHVLDVNVDYVGRDGEKDMHDLVKRLVTNVNLPLMLDSTEWQKMEAGLKVAGGKCILNSTNYEDGNERFFKVLELAKRYGAAVVVGTIDEVGMARTAEGKFAIAQRAYRDALEFGIPAHEIFYDPLALPISTGIEEDRGNGAATIEAIRRIRAQLPGVHVVLGVSNISFGLSPATRIVLNSVFLHECCSAGLDAAIISPAKILPLAKINDDTKQVCLDLINDARRFDGDVCTYDPLAELTKMFEGVSAREARESGPSLADLPVDKRLSQHIIDGERIGLEVALNEALTGYPPLQIINTFLLDGMKVVGELFGSGQMQLPFVLQSAETMKAAVAFLEPHMEKTEGERRAKAKFLIATVKGDVHDIGKNLVDIILTNNGYEVINLGIKQPVEAIIEAQQLHQADCIAMSGLLVKSTAFMKDNLQAFNQAGIAVPVILGGAALTPRFVNKDCRSVYKGQVIYGRDAFSDLRFMDALAEAKQAGHWDDLQGFLAGIPEGLGLGSEPEPASDEQTSETSTSAEGSPENGLSAEAAAERPEGASAAGSLQSHLEQNLERSEAVPEEPAIRPPFLGSRVLDEAQIPLAEVFAYLDRNALFAGQWQLRKTKQQSRDDYEQMLAEKAEPILTGWIERCLQESLLTPRVAYGYFPCGREGNSVVVFDPANPGVELGRFVLPRQRAGNRYCVADFYRDLDDGRPTDLLPMQAVTMGEGASAFARELFAADRYTDYLYFHGLGVQMAEALAEWVHARIRLELGFGSEEPALLRDVLAQRYRGSRYSFGYPACPNVADSRPQLDWLGAERIGLSMDESDQLEPEQSTTALVALHSQARYFSA
ncbi:methionine synthase [Synechococcus sp. CS-602]|uniref:methionine synthase n=1 Tax=Synechococcaceae TaxID=1890426 RepID=UPI0008FF5CFE|nr:MULTISPECIES: methionine synthase [Synechococcaceae]APD48948.1 methionine synthase [Synechococcus sp. SynAce01]MCT0204569.1 methionine synthase [Synechococcus sp. CS-602]MCT0246373.1 methionine synthase [Synechococcus sp. CS-601]MCT4367119.1 methionine synthase [Candidatus Regnicoccus frigidus MAG-AL2]